MEQNLKLGIDLASISTLVATLVGWLPSVATIFTIIWTGIQIYDWYKRKDKQ